MSLVFSGFDSLQTSNTEVKHRAKFETVYLILARSVKVMPQLATDMEAIDFALMKG